MAVTARNIFAGPVDVHVAPFGAEEPADAVAPLSAAWRDVGGTSGGTRLLLNQTYADLEVDQVPESVGSFPTGRTVQVATTMAESTLENWATALNELEDAVVTAGGTETLEPSNLSTDSEPNYGAVCLTGAGPSGKRRRFILRRALSVESIESDRNKTAQTGIPVTWKGHYVSPSIKPYRKMDTDPSYTP
jgi:hypothetical protein